MSIKRIKYSVVFVIVFFSCVNLAHAEVIFNEIAWMGNSSNINAEWIELKGEKGTDLSNWTISGSVSITIPEGKRINENGFFLLGRQPVDKKITYTYIPDFIPDYTYNGTLPNSSGNLILKNSSGVNKDSISWLESERKNYQTKQRINDSGWNYADPTPNDTNSGVSDDNSSEENIVEETNDTITTTTNEPKIYKIATKIIAPKIVTAGVPFTIDHSTTGLNKEKIILGKFVWNFGDGMQKQLSLSDPFSYGYDYPGEYVITLSYYDSIFDINPDAMDRLIIKVIPSGVIISSVGTYADPFVEIENNSSYEMSLNKWIMKGYVHSFLIPEGMVILPNKKLKFSPKITGFDFNDLNSISIIDTSGQVFATYPTKKTYSNKNYSNSNSQNNIVKADIVKSDQAAGIANSPDVINLNDLGASAGSADNGLNNKTLVYLGLAGIIAIGLLSIFLIRRKNEIPDYVEKGISASDMTIME
ncbi:MAG: hypothetical protein WCW04_02750 [Candidatus Paceibacterota bacterium]